MARLEGIFQPDDLKVMNVSYVLGPSFSLFIYEFDVVNFDCLLAPSPICGRLTSPKADRLTSSKTGTLAKGCLRDPRRCITREQGAPHLSCLFLTLFLPLLGCVISWKS